MFISRLLFKAREGPNSLRAQPMYVFSARCLQSLRSKPPNRACKMVERRRGRSASARGLSPPEPLRGLRLRIGLVNISRASDQTGVTSAVGRYHLCSVVDTGAK